MQGLGKLVPLGRTGVPALAAALLACRPGRRFFWGSGPLSWSFWRADRPYQYWATHYLPGSHARYVDRIVEQVPPDAPVLASDYLLIRLSQRPAIYHFFQPPPEPVLDRVDYAVVDLFENHIRTPQTRARERVLLRQLQESDDFALAAAEDGVLFFERDGPAGLLSQAVTVDLAAPQHTLDVDLGEHLRLLGYDFTTEELIPGQVYAVSYYWQVLPGYAEPFVTGDFPQVRTTVASTTDYVLIDTFQGAGGAYRVLHLPTYTLLRPERWRPGQLIRETYEFSLPKTLPEGTYEWSVGLYAEPGWFGIRTDDAGLVPGSERVVMGKLGLGTHE